MQNRDVKALDWLVAKPIAHRGLHDIKEGRVENSVSAARAAIVHGFAIECDVQLTSDGEAVIFHDFELDRLTNINGAIRDSSAAKLAVTPLKGSSETITTLPLFLSEIAGHVPLIIEIKSRFDNDLRLTRRVVEILAEYDAQVAVKSFDPDCVAELYRIAPHIPRGYIAMSSYEYDEFEHLSTSEKHALANLLHYERMMPDFLSWSVKDLLFAAPFLGRNALNLPLMTWTVRNPADHAYASAHADQMIFEGFVP